MKKSLIAIFCVMFCLALCACGNNAIETEQSTEDEQVVLEETVKDSRTLIFESENLKSALGQFGELYENAETEEEKQELETYMNEYFLEDLSGYLYFLNPEHKAMHVESDNRAIYVKSMDEVYVVPYSEQELQAMELDLEDLPQIENSELYKYHISEIQSGIKIDKSPSGDKRYFQSKVLLVSDYLAGEEITRFNSMQIECLLVPKQEIRYQTYGCFADEIDLISDYDKEKGYAPMRDYLRSEELALSWKKYKDGIDSEWMIEQGWIEGEKDNPAIGMTKEQVLSSTWGTPDRKNIDEYSWGTQEQWVYENQGYIYFEDGVVTSISKQE